MPTLTDRLVDDPATPAAQLEAHLVDLPALIGSALEQLVGYAEQAVDLVDERHHAGPGFLSVEAKRRLNDLIRKDRRAQHENRMLALKLTGPVPTPVSVVAVSISNEIDRFIRDLVDDLHRRVRRAGVCLLAERHMAVRGRPTNLDLVWYARALLGVYTNPVELRRLHSAAEDLVDRARRFVDGVQSVEHPEPCPWCHRRTLVAHLADGIIRCESDPDTGLRLPCVCSDSYCECRTNGRFRHEWHQTATDLRRVIRDGGADPDDFHAHSTDHTDTTPRRLRYSQTWYGLRSELNRLAHAREQHAAAMATKDEATSATDGEEPS